MSQYTRPKSIGPNDAFNQEGGEVFSPDCADLARLHALVRIRKCLTVLELGSGVSTKVIADALSKNYDDYQKDIELVRRQNPFKLFSIESEEKYLETTRNSLGEAGKNTNLAPTEDESKYMNIFKYSSIAIFLVVTSGFAGLWSVDPQLLNQLTVYLILIVAISYFIYLFFFAGLGTDEIENIKMLLLLFFGAVLFWAGFDQGGSSLNLFAKDYTDLFIFGWEMPATFLQVANPLMVVIFAPFFAAFWISLGKKNLDPDTPQKFALGCFLMAIGFLVIIFGVEAAMQNEKAGIQFLLMTYLFHTLGELCLSPVGLSATAKYSPIRYRGQMMGIWFLSSSLAAGLAGLLASKSFEAGIASMPDLFMQIIIALFVVGILLLISNRFLKATEIKEGNKGNINNSIN